MVVLNKKMPGWNKQAFGGGMNSNKKVMKQKYEAHKLNQASTLNTNLTNTGSNKVSVQDNLFTKANIKKGLQGLQKKINPTLNEQSNKSMTKVPDLPTSDINAWNTPKNLQLADLTSISVTPASKLHTY